MSQNIAITKTRTQVSVRIAGDRGPGQLLGFPVVAIVTIGGIRWLVTDVRQFEAEQLSQSRFVTLMAGTIFVLGCITLLTIIKMFHCFGVEEIVVTDQHVLISERLWMWKRKLARSFGELNDVREHDFQTRRGGTLRRIAFEFASGTIYSWMDLEVESRTSVLQTLKDGIADIRNR